MNTMCVWVAHSMLSRLTHEPPHRVQPVLIQRFLIHLRYIDTGESASEIDHLSRFTAPQFRTPTMPGIIGNLGESLDFMNDSESIHDRSSAVYAEVPDSEDDTATEESDEDMFQGHTHTDSIQEVCCSSSSLMKRP